MAWWVKFLRACFRQCRNNLHIDSTYLQTYTDDNVQNTHTYTQYTQYTIRHTYSYKYNTHYTPYVQFYRREGQACGGKQDLEQWQNREEEDFFICHIHNYTEYNLQWNVFSAFNPSKCTHTWSSGQLTLRHSWGFGALLKGITSVVDNSCRSRDSNPQPRVTSPTLYPLGHGCHPLGHEYLT